MPQPQDRHSDKHVPEMMDQIEITGPGAPEVMHVARGPVPTPKPDELLIRVLAAGVNRPDVSQRKGHYPPPASASPILGLEVAGEVVALGSAVTQWQVGDKVTALTNGGGYAQYAVAPAPQCLPWPDGYDAVRAAALPENYFTVWANLFQLGRLQAGESALVHGGTSGIGLTAIQLAREMGAKIYATAGSDEKCAACLRFGANGAINYRTQDFVAELLAMTEKQGVDVVLDFIAGDYVQRDLACLKMFGRAILIGGQGGRCTVPFDFGLISRRRLTITGSTMRPRTTADKGRIADELRERVWPALSAGRAGPVIHQVFPLAEVAAAHALMESSAHIGKIMLTVVP
jgi:NADPH2:quinone reductase